MNTRKDVLVVEDDPDMVDIMLLVLRGAGYAARGAENGKQALEAVAARMPALILLDMLMPVMDGWQFAREMSARYGRAVPIVVVTAAEHARARSEEIGADDVLPKPFDVDDLLRLVARHGVEPVTSRPDS
jgi:CheY-like chemotaxis protein